MHTPLSSRRTPGPISSVLVMRTGSATRGKNVQIISASDYGSRRSPGRPRLQLPCIAEGKTRHAARVLVEDQRAGDRGLGALAAVFALAEPAVDADRRAFGGLEIQAGGVDQPRGVADFAAEPDGETRLRLRMGRHRPA